MRAPGFSSLRSLGRSLSLNSGDRNSVTTLAPPKSVVKRSSVMNRMRSSTPARRAFSRLSAMRWVDVHANAPRAVAHHCRDDDAAIAAAQVVDHVAGGDLRHLEHGVDHFNRRRL